MLHPAPALPWYELARFRRSSLTRLAILAVAVVPLFYGALYIWANADPTGNLDKVQAAIVNNDEMVDVEGPDGEQRVAIGRELAAQLVDDDSGNNYDWVLADPNDAEAGLAVGKYKAVLEIPENLSRAATSTSGDPADAIQGNLEVRTNDAVNFVNGQIADRILAAATSSLNAQVTASYLDNVYLTFTDIKTSLRDAADGAGELASGAGELATGAGQLSSGAQELGGGLDELAGGLGTLQDRTGELPGQTARLADGAEQVAAGTAEIDGLVQQVVGAVQQGSGEISEVRGQLRELADECRENGPAGFDCGLIDDAVDRLGTVSSQAGSLGARSSQLASGARQVAEGNRQLASGISELDDAVGEAADGAGQLRSGTAELADGASQLSDGASELRSGAGSLQDGLDEGSDEVPDYDESEREKLSETVAMPITDAAKRLNEVSTYGEGLAPYFMALALWVGAMAIYLLLRPMSDRAVASAASSTRTAIAGFVPGALLSALQSALLVAVLLLVVGIDAAQPGLLLGLALLTGLVFTAVNQTFVAWFGGAGRFAAIVFVCLQLTAAGGTYPVETSPGFFSFLHSLLPMTYAVHGMRAATAGGSAGVGFDVFCLVLFGLGALALTTLSAYRRQRLTVTRLHPTLQL